MNEPPVLHFALILYYLKIVTVLRGAVVARSAHNREILGSNPGRSGKSMGDFSETLHPCPPSSEWVPDVIREL